MSSIIRVLLADDQPMVLEPLALYLNRQNDIRVIAQCEDGRKAVELARETCPDVAILDQVMPLLSGLDAARQILKAVPGVRVIIISGYPDPDHVREAQEAGVHGYLFKARKMSDLLRAIREVAAGGAFVFAGIPSAPPEAALELLLLEKLTPRERDVLALIVEGKSNKEAAGILNLSEKTVHQHRLRLMEKLGIRDVVGLTRFAVRVGLIFP